MEALWKFLKIVAHFIVWSVNYVIYKPAKWAVVTGAKIYSDSKKPKFETTSAMSDVQRESAKNLPELTKKRTELQSAMKKLADKHAVMATELKGVESLIAIAGGDFGQNKQPQRNNNKQNNQNQKQNNQKQNNQNNQNNGQKQVPALGDADFA